MGWGTRSWAIAALVVVVAVFGAGFAVGRHSVTTTHSAVGQGDSSKYQVTVKADGWAYDIPLDTPWIDRSGTTHEGARPVCLPPTSVVRNVHFEWTAWHVGTQRGRTVVQVDCP